MNCLSMVINAVSWLSDPQTLVFGHRQGGAVSAFDFSEVTGVEAGFFQDGTLVESADPSDTGVFDWSGGEGELVVDFGLVGLAAGRYQVRIVVEKPDHPAGLVFNRGDGYTLDLVMVE